MKRYDIAVAYRIYPKVSRTPLIYANDKYKLSELCLNSFKRALGTLSAKIYVIFDNCPVEYRALFRNLFSATDLEELSFDGIGNLGTFEQQIKVLMEQDVSENVYFAEDDYFYLPNAISDMLCFMKSGKGIDFVSVYDHPDLYNMELHNHMNSIRVYNGHHWRTANSTCLTFMSTRDNLSEAKHVFESYAKGNKDASLWLGLTKWKLGSDSLIKCFHNEHELFRYSIRAWKYCWQYILFGRRMNLWVPIPSLGTHLERQFLAPALDWAQLMHSSESKVK